MNDTNDCKPSANTPSTNKPPFIQRKSPRAAFHDYNNGDYFVTICTKGHKHYFGKIENGEMKLSQMGIFATNALENLPSHYKYAQVLLFVVMPNNITLNSNGKAGTTTISSAEFTTAIISPNIFKTMLQDGIMIVTTTPSQNNRKHTSKAIIRKSHNSRDAPQVQCCPKDLLIFEYN